MYVNKQWKDGKSSEINKTMKETFIRFSHRDLCYVWKEMFWYWNLEHFHFTNDKNDDDDQLRPNSIDK